MRRLLAILFSLTVLSWAAPAAAEIPGLQVYPLQIKDALSTNAKIGYIDVSNPSDTAISIASNVQGFRQAGTDGHLAFFDDAQISSGIKVDLPTFDLGPREAIRVAFSVDPAKLPKGGVYAVIFFRTLPPAQNSNSSYVSESANIGTLLLLQNGPAGAHIGEISSLHLPFWQFGTGVKGTVSYRNTDRSKTAAGFNPNLGTKVFPWGKSTNLTTGLVLPTSERTFEFSRPGAYFGLLPITVTDSDTGKHATHWIFAITGWYQLATLIALTCLVLAVFLRPRRLLPALRRFISWLRRRFSRRRPAPRRQIDGLVAKK